MSEHICLIQSEKNYRNKSEYRNSFSATVYEGDEFIFHIDSYGDIEGAVVKMFHEFDFPDTDTLEFMWFRDGERFRMWARQPLSIWYARTKIKPWYSPNERKKKDE